MAKAKATPKSEYIRQVPLADIVVPDDPDRFRPGDLAIDELAASIAEHGLLQPILISTGPDDTGYELIAGQRRLLATTRLGRTTIAARILEIPEGTDSTIRLVENIHRLDLSPLEEAVAVKRLRDQQGLTQEEAAEQLAKGVSWIKHRESLLRLPDDVMDALHAGKVNPSVALQLARIDDDDVRPFYLQSAIDYGATQDVAEAWVTNYQIQGAKASPETLQETVQSYAHATGENQLACHVCERLYTIINLRTVLVCTGCHPAISGATRNVPAGEAVQ